MVRRIGHANFGKGPSGRQLLAATDSRAHAANDGASLDHDERVAGVAGFQPPALDAFGVKDLDAGSRQGRDHRIVLRLHCRQVGRRLALEVPPLFDVAERADFRDTLRWIDHRHLGSGPMHENAADLPDIVVDAPDPPPMPLELGFVLERRGGGRREHLDRLSVDPMRVAIVQHWLSPACVWLAR